MPARKRPRAAPDEEEYPKRQTPSRPRGDAPAGPRPFWSGVISFGLVSVPVALYPSSRPARVSLRMLDAEGAPLRREYVCPQEGKVLDDDEIVRGYEVEKGRFVTVTDEELEALEPRKSQDIDLTRFVPADAIPPLYFERGYILTPSGSSTKAYRLLAAAMESSGRAGIATFVMRDKEYLVAIFSEGGILRAETMRFEDEIRTPEQIGLPEPAKTSATVVRTMRTQVDALTKKTVPARALQDDSAKKLLALVERKRRTKKNVVRTAEAGEGAPEEPIDLLEVIRRRMSA